MAKHLSPSGKRSHHSPLKFGKDSTDFLREELALLEGVRDLRASRGEPAGGVPRLITAIKLELARREGRGLDKRGLGL